MVLKSARIVYFFGESSGFVDFENTADRGSDVNLTRIPDRAYVDVRMGPK